MSNNNEEIELQDVHDDMGSNGPSDEDGTLITRNEDPNTAANDKNTKHINVEPNTVENDQEYKASSSTLSSLEDDSGEHSHDSNKVPPAVKKQTEKFVHFADLPDVPSKKKKFFKNLQNEMHLGKRIRGFLFGIFFAFTYVVKENRKKVVNFSIGLITVVTVVFIVSVVYNIIQKAPLIFLKLGEDNVGEMDVLFNTQFTNASQNVFVNVTEVNELLKENNYITNVVPRWIIPGGLTVINPDDPLKNMSATLLMIDTEKEDEIQLGRTWKHRPLGRQEVHVKDSVLKVIGKRPNRGDRINIRLNIQSMINILSGNSQSITQGVDSADGSIASFNGTGDLLKQLLTTAGITEETVIPINVTQLANQANLTETQRNQVDLLTLFIGSDVVNVTVGNLFALTNIDLSQEIPLQSEFIIIDEVVWPEGKYPPAIGNVIIVDSTQLTSIIEDILLGPGSPFSLLFQLIGNTTQIENAINNIKPEEIAFMGIAKFENRFPYYSRPYSELKPITISDSIYSQFGMNKPISVSYPLITAIEASSFISLFLDQIFITMTFMLALLGCLVVFGLLFSMVEEKTYEYGMLRSFGLTKIQLIEVIMVEALYFAIPGILLALLMAFFVNLIAQAGLNLFLHLPTVDPWLNYLAVIIPIALGLGISIISNIMPIRASLSRTLRDSLDLTHQVGKATTVHMIKLEKLGLTPIQTVMSILLVVAGFIVYYMIPYAFIFENLGLFLTILNGVLLAMLLGMCLVAVVLQPIFEKGILWCMVCGPDRKLRSLIMKNQTGHRRRSKKTYLMIVISVAFIIFATVMFDLQTKSIVQNVELFLGADIVMQSTTSSYSLPYDDLNAFLIEQKEEKRVKSHSYATFDFTKLSMMNDVDIGLLHFYPSADIKLVGLSKNFLETTKSEYFAITEKDTEFSYEIVNGKEDLIASLYDDAGKAKTVNEKEQGLMSPDIVYSGDDGQFYNTTKRYREYLDVILSAAMIPSISSHVGVPHAIRILYKLGSSQQRDYILGKPRGLIYKCPGFIFSSYSVAASGSTVFLSLDQYRSLKNKVHDYRNENATDIRYEKLYIRIDTPLLNSTEKALFLHALSKRVNIDFVNIQDVSDIVASTSTAKDALNYAFITVSIIASLLCFFNLLISFRSNVKDNSWEFGVLRSIGISVGQLIRCFIYESLVLVLAAFINGAVIGCVIAMSLTAQFNLFLENPFSFTFPYVIFFSLLGMSLLVGIIGSYIPASNLKKKDIALVLRGLE